MKMECLPIEGSQRLYSVTLSKTPAKNIPATTKTDLFTQSLPPGTYIAVMQVRRDQLPRSQTNIFPFIYNSRFYMNWGNPADEKESGDIFVHMFTLDSQTTIGAGLYVENAITVSIEGILQIMRIA